MWVGISLAGRGVDGLKQPIVRFGASVNDPPKSIELNGWKTNRSLVQMEQNSVVVNVQLKGRKLLDGVFVSELINPLIPSQALPGRSTGFALTPKMAGLRRLPSSEGWLDR
ncbi:hypothetical protein AVEN_34284-1 [Araneus ventricosus]|uniref:Uncharacterized protein n=1 Tax=Araneus ventricosus TaxID=182803 RepID=A0A4Y2R1R8_ARAVE|nr:hypothetical protein AVEN_34284-1 [Araneus ventricosus]